MLQEEIPIIPNIIPIISKDKARFHPGGYLNAPCSRNTFLHEVCIATVACVHGTQKQARRTTTLHRGAARANWRGRLPCKALRNTLALKRARPRLIICAPTRLPPIVR